MRMNSRIRFMIIGTTLLLSADIRSQGRSNSTLPVMFDNVRISLKSTGVLIEWSNLTERELINYVVERSSDARTYTELNRFVPRSNQNEPESYSDIDPSPAAGLNYYRIKVNEMSGKVIVSKVLKIETFRDSPGFSIYPNPVTGGQLSWSASNLVPGRFTLTILSFSGVPVYNREISIQGKSVSETIDLPYKLCPGVYRLMLSSDDVMNCRTFVIP